MVKAMQPMIEGIPDVGAQIIERNTIETKDSVPIHTHLYLQFALLQQFVGKTHGLHIM